MDILKLYKGIIESLNGAIDEQGLISFRYNDQLFPGVVNERRLALPTPERLRTGDWNGLIAFHPMSENELRGESVVLKQLKGLINVRLQAVLGDLLSQLVRMAANRSGHSKMKGKAHELLSHLPEVDEKSVQAMDKIIEATEIDGPNRLISLYLKRGGTLRGARYSRVAVVSFPILEAFDKDDDHTVFGYKLRKKDFTAFHSLFEYIFDELEEGYSVGSRSMVAPYLDSLLKAYIKVASRLNVIIDRHRAQLANAEELYTNLDWEDLAADLKIYHHVIPTLEGNDGEPVQQEQQTGATVVDAKPLPAVLAGNVRGTITPLATPASAPSIPSLPDAKPSNPFNVEFAQQEQQRQAEQARAAAAASNVRVDANGIKHTGRGLDFESVRAAQYRQATGFTPQPAAVVPQAGYPMMGQPGYAMPPPGYGAVPPGYPPPMAPVAPGGYAGHYRGMPQQPMMGGYGVPPGMMGPPPPSWVTNPSTVQTVGTVPTPGYNPTGVPFPGPYVYNPGYPPPGGI